MADMRKLIDIAAGNVLFESTTKRKWVLYHGTKSNGFSTFMPTDAAKGKQHWNPLGNGMYATNDPRFASDFGGNVFEVDIPAGTSYRRINRQDWFSLGPSLVIKALKQAMKACGTSYEEWQNGVCSPAPRLNLKTMTRAGITDFLVACYSRRIGEQVAEKVRQAAADRTDDQLKAFAAAEIKNWKIAGHELHDRRQKA